MSHQPPAKCAALGRPTDTLFAILMLTTTDRQIIDFERCWWLLPGPKDRTISDVLGLDPAAYYARLRTLIDSTEADHYDPLTVRRLRKWVGSGAV